MAGLTLSHLFVEVLTQKFTDGQKNSMYLFITLLLLYTFLGAFSYERFVGAILSNQATE